MAGDLFAYEIDGKALARAERMDGKLLLVTNVTDLTATEIVARYKALADRLVWHGKRGRGAHRGP